jgi:quercetin dioxygenase-like cupin family protein
VHVVVKDKALDFVLGALSPAERGEVEEARRIDPALDREIDTLEAQLSPLTGAAGEIPPPPALYSRIAAALASQDREHEGKYSEMVTEGRWLHYKPGIEAKRLWQKRTVMLRCQPGAVLPAHDHDEDEHIVVISGDFVVGGRSYGPGDYHFSPKGNAHGDAFTRGGCLLLVQYAA